MGIRLILMLALVILLSLASCDVDFTGLIRSTDRIGDRFVLSEVYNEINEFENITVDELDYELIIASDLHIGQTKNTEKLFEIYQEHNAKALVLVGDLVSGKRKDYEILKNLTDSLTKPYFCLVGNHDLYFDGWKTFFEFYGSSIYYFTIQTPLSQDLYICLDSGGGTIGKSQLDWLETLLKEEREKYRHCVLFSHVNILRTRRTTSANPIKDEVYQILDLFEKYNVNLVITGHDHLQDEAFFGKTTYLILDALVDKNKNAGYLNLTISELLNYEFIRFNQ